jgi:hypothetical protein
LILRVISGRIAAGQLDAVRSALERDYVPAALSRPGLQRFLVATRPASDGHEIAMMTVWADVDSAMKAYRGNLDARSTLDGIGHGETLDRVDYYEVDISEVRLRSGVPRHLRLTSGSVGQGLDADIQRSLRQRLGDLEDEAVEAYVGRRVKGNVVEIAFVSTWTEGPARALDQPIWPDISASYDSFVVGVYDVLLHGVSGRAAD